MTAIVALVVARVAFLVAMVCAVALHTRHRGDRSAPRARQLRSAALWAAGIGVLAVIIFAVAE